MSPSVPRCSQPALPARQAADFPHKFLNLVFMDLVPVSGVPRSMWLVIKTAAVLHYRAVTSASLLTWAAP